MIDEQEFHLEDVQFAGQDKILSYQSFISNSFFKQFAIFFNSYGVPTRFKLSTATIANLDLDFLIKTHGRIGLFSNPSFKRYSLRRLYHMRPDCFNPYRDLYSLIEYILRDVGLYVLGILYPSGICM